MAEVRSRVLRRFFLGWLIALARVGGRGSGLAPSGVRRSDGGSGAAFLAFRAEVVTDRGRLFLRFNRLRFGRGRRCGDDV